MKLEKLKEMVKTSCGERRRELLLSLIDTVGDRLEKAPASTAVRYHHAYEGGLLDHIIEVAETASKLNHHFTVSEESIITVAILHDLNKIGDTMDIPHYVPNISEKTGKRSEAEPFKKEKKCRRGYPPTGFAEIGSILGFADLSDGEASLALMVGIDTKYNTQIIENLTESEINAIRYHDGGYGKAKYATGYQGKEDALAILIHAADMLSSRKQLQ